MSAIRRNLVIDQGASFSETLAIGQLRNGYTCRAYLYDYFGGALLATFVASAVATGVTTVTLDASTTGALVAPTWADSAAREVKLGVWELESVSGANVYREYQGDVILSRRSSGST